MNVAAPLPDPQSVEAEQQLLGAILCDNARLDMVSLRASDFYEPAHGRLFAAIVKRAKDGVLASPVTMRLFAEADEGLNQLGGGRYLARLAGASVSASQVAEYGALVREYAARREVLAAIKDAQRALVDDSQSADEVSARLEGALAARESGKDSTSVSMMSAVTGAMQTTIAAYHGEETPGVRTGIPSLDAILGKLSPGQLILLGGRPSMGKSAVALSMALNVARQGGGVIISTLEMTPEAMAQRALSEATARASRAVSYAQMATGEMTEQQMHCLADASKEVAELPIRFLPATFRDTGALYAGVKRSKGLLGSAGLKLVVVDYLQLLKGLGSSRFEQIAEISIALKSLAMQLGVPVLALSQLSRAVENREDKRPMLSDLRESGQLEQDADAVMFCYRHEYYLEREQPDESRPVEEHEAWKAARERTRNKLEIAVAKQRQGPIGTAHVCFNPALNLIWER